METLGTATFTVQVSPTLELDLSNVVVSVGDFYQALIGVDILGGKPECWGLLRLSCHPTQPWAIYSGDS